MIQNHLPHDHGQTIEHELEYMPSVEYFQAAGGWQPYSHFLVALPL